MTEPLTVKLLHVVGTRPNFMKAAAVIRAAEQWSQAATSAAASAPTPSSTRPPVGGSGCDSSAPGTRPVRFEQVLVHTGQHYDEKMSKVFFDDLGLPRPDYDLGTGSGSHAEQTGRVMIELEPLLLKEAPDLVIVVGDVNSTMAATVTAAKLHIPVAHVEAGLRSRDRAMPEELNRLVADQLADLLFTTSRDADDNLAAEGILAERVFFVGNTMIDTLLSHLPAALERNVVEESGLPRGGYAVVTLHRPSNVDEAEGLANLTDLLVEIGSRLSVIFPVHARTRQRLADFGLTDRLEGASIKTTNPLGYLDFLCLMANSRVVITDSGGMQEETTILGIPCLTLRKNTERPVTIIEGTNRLVDPEDYAAVLAATDEVLAAPMPVARQPEYWDGHAGERIVGVIAELARGGGLGRG